MRSVIRLLPGPTTISAETRRIYGEPWDTSPDTNDAFFERYAQCTAKLGDLLEARRPGTTVALMSGEAMVALWGAVKSVVGPGDRVVCLSNGLFGTGFADMARAAGAATTLLESDWRGPLDTAKLAGELARQPAKLVTAVHCETPSGQLNTAAVAEAGRVCRAHGALFLVDFVASAFGTRVSVDDWEIDLGLCGTQKVLSLPQDLGLVSVSARAWKAVEARRYEGYDALLPFRTAVERRHMPYTHNWRAIEALAQRLQETDLAESFARHERVAHQCRTRLARMGLALYGAPELASPTVTAALVPPGWTWPELRGRLLEEGVELGGSYGPLKDKVMRVGHMGSQADSELVATALDRLEKVLRSKM
jgi:aspartate aminotransferase-like enzyme